MFSSFIINKIKSILIWYSNRCENSWHRVVHSPELSPVYLNWPYLSIPLYPTVFCCLTRKAKFTKTIIRSNFPSQLALIELRSSLFAIDNHHQQLIKSITRVTNTGRGVQSCQRTSFQNIVPDIQSTFDIVTLDVRENLYMLQIFVVDLCCSYQWYIMYNVLRNKSNSI